MLVRLEILSDEVFGDRCRFERRQVVSVLSLKAKWLLEA